MRLAPRVEAGGAAGAKCGGGRCGWREGRGGRCGWREGGGAVRMEAATRMDEGGGGRCGCARRRQ